LLAGKSASKAKFDESKFVLISEINVSKVINILAQAENAASVNRDIIFGKPDFECEKHKH